MLTFDEAAAWLDECMDKLPKGIFARLNGGVNLMPDAEYDEDGLLTMGMYIRDYMGRRVEIYYGSFVESMADATDDEVRSELEKTLKHELTHHVETMAGDRSLEKRDEREREELLNDFAPLDAQSVLFVDRDDASLAPLCEAVFRKACQEKGLSFASDSAGLSAAKQVDKKCAAAAGDFGVNMSAAVPKAVTAQLLENFDAVLCLSKDIATELAEAFPEYEEKIMCLGYTDYAAPRFALKSLWTAMCRAMEKEVENLLGDMTGDYNA